jgi:hypothetical protein
MAVAVHGSGDGSGGGGDTRGIPTQYRRYKIRLAMVVGPGVWGCCVDGKSISEEPCLCRRGGECGGAWHGGFSGFGKGSGVWDLGSGI